MKRYLGIYNCKNLKDSVANLCTVRCDSVSHRHWKILESCQIFGDLQLPVCTLQVQRGSLSIPRNLEMESLQLVPVNNSYVRQNRPARSQSLNGLLRHLQTLKSEHMIRKVCKGVSKPLLQACMKAFDMMACQRSFHKGMKSLGA